MDSSMYYGTFTSEGPTENPDLYGEEEQETKVTFDDQDYETSDGLDGGRLWWEPDPTFPPGYHQHQKNLTRLLGNNQGFHETTNYDDSFHGLATTASTFLGIANNHTATFDGEEDLEDFPHGINPSAIIVPVVFILIFIVGCLGNGTLIHIFIRHKELRTTPNVYIVVLSIGDLCVVIFCIPFVSTIYTFTSWQFGSAVCKIGEFVMHTSTGISVFTLTALSVDRYIAITHPMRSRVGNNPRRLTYMVVTFIVLFAIACAMPFLIYTDVVPKGPQRILVCHPYPEEFGANYEKAMVVYKALLYYFIPLSIITGFYISMARRLVQSAASMPGEARARRQINSRKNVAKMVLGFVFFFALCFLPTHIFFLWFYFHPDAHMQYNMFWHVLRICGFTLSFTNSCINPVVMYCVSSTFRLHFNRYLFCWCARNGGAGFGNSPHRDSMASGNGQRGYGIRMHSTTVFNTNTSTRRSTTTVGGSHLNVVDGTVGNNNASLGELVGTNGSSLLHPSRNSKGGTSSNSSSRRPSNNYIFNNGGSLAVTRDASPSTRTTAV